MAKNLTIILGAGASHSLNPGGKVLDNQGYRPPLTKDIFGKNREFRIILRSFPLAEILASDIDRQLRQNKPGVGLEQILESYEKELKNGKNNLITRQFLQIPLYLNELFGKISTGFTSQPDEYNTLVNLTLKSLDGVLFLTLNYDNLLEIPLSKNYGVDFSKEKHYINEKWRLVKLHGSINWYKEFSSRKEQEPTDAKYFDLLKTSTLPLSLENSFTLTSMNGYGRRYFGRVPVYPAITVPVNGKYDINCPELHQKAARDFLSTCNNYLIVGTSGNDRDLFDMLKDNAKSGKVLVVGKEENDTGKTREKFMTAVPQFQRNISIYFHNRGFSEFVDSGELDNFLVRLR